VRTNIVIDDELMARAGRVSGLTTKREIVERAILEFVERRERKDITELFGSVQFAEGYDYKALREGARKP
jgi:Arc/MetJ family transcription regulator